MNGTWNAWLWVALIAGLANPVRAEDLATYKARYEQALETIILEHGIKIGDLNTQYGAALDAVLARVKKAGDLDKTSAVMAEKERFEQSKAMPPDPAALPELQSAQAAYAERLDGLEAGKCRRIVTLAEQFDAALEPVQKDLVASDKLDEARAMQDERLHVAMSEVVTAARAYLASLAPPPTQPPPPAKPATGSATNTAAKSGGNRPSIAPPSMIGIWEYTAKGHLYRREFTMDKRCILSREGKVIWERPYKRLSATKAYVLSADGDKAYHEIERDGTMSIDGGFIARRVGD